MDKQAIRDEIIACGRDVNYFIRKYIKIQHPLRGLIPFALFDYQEQLLCDYRRYRFNIILKARQLGISEVTAAYSVWLMLFHRDKNILVMASKADTAKNIIKKVKTAFKKLPRWLMLAESTTNNKLSVELTNGSQIKAIATSEDAGRSEALSLLIIDEAAFVKRFGELWTGLYPAVSAGGSAIVLSTPNGVGEKFHQMYVDAMEGENDFHPTRLMWWRHPERISDLEDDPFRPGFKTSSWYRNEIKSTNMSPRDVAQELDCSFNASGETVISADSLQWIEEGLLDPVSKESIDRNLHVWWRPQPGKRYLISADVARGDGKDYSSAHVWDLDCMEQAAEYYGKIPPDDFAKVLHEIGTTYNRALVVIENNTIGLACLQHLKLLTYENVYYSRKGDHKTGEAVNTYWGPATSDLVPGFTTSPKTRPLIIAKLEEYVRNKNIIFRSKRSLEELRTFIWSSGRPEAMSGYNDDLVIAAAIGVWIRDTFLAPSLVDADMQKKLMAGITINKTLNTEIDGASKDPRYVSTRSMNVQQGTNRNPMQIKLPNGYVADFSWLITSG